MSQVRLSPYKYLQFQTPRGLINAILHYHDITPFIGEVLNDNIGWSALVIIARNTNTWSSEQQCSQLIKAGVNVNLQFDFGYSALILAARYSNTDSTIGTVKILVDAGSNLDLQDHVGFTALMWSLASSESNETTSSMLVNAGANVNLSSHAGNTALALAMNSYSTINTIGVLLNAGANIEYKYPEGTSILHNIARNANVITDKYKIFMLLNANPNLNDIGHDGYTVLIWMAEWSQHPIYTSGETLKYLINHLNLRYEFFECSPMIN